MKKKGLIISTVVMVVVLIASLTTATYAWFTASNEVTVDPIEFAIGAGADMIIGVSQTNSIVAAPTNAAFRSGTTEYTLGSSFSNAGNWSGTEGLGSNVDLGNLDLKTIQKAVGTGTFTGTQGSWTVNEDDTRQYTDGTNLGGSADTSFNYANYKNGMIKAEGQGTTVYSNTIDSAWKQFDYLDVVIGVKATKTDLQKMMCYITVNPTQGSIVGMNGAIHVAYAVVSDQTGAAETTLTDEDIYGTSYNYRTLNSTVTNTVFEEAKTAAGQSDNSLACLGGSASTSLNAGAITKGIQIDSKSGEDVIDTETIYQIHLVIFIAGYDGDCQEAAKGVASTIYITFAGTAKAA